MSRYVLSNAGLVLKALKIAERAHKGQFRRSTGAPYFHHPVTVAIVVAGFKQSKHLAEILCAAILHDTLEDTELTFSDIAKMFTPLVASIVQELTNDKEEIERIGKLAYHKKKLVGMSSYSLTIKLADRLHNVSDNPTEKMVTETIELIVHLKKQRKLTKAQKELAKEILTICMAKKI
jgi:GTP pyrophosphokinase